MWNFRAYVYSDALSLYMPINYMSWKKYRTLIKDRVIFYSNCNYFRKL